MGLLFVLPAVVMYSLFFVWPFANSVVLSFVSWNGVAPTKKFVGIDNFTRAVADPLFWGALSHNVIWIIGGTFLSVSLALFLAILVSRMTRFQYVVSTIFFLPVLLSSAAIGVAWVWIYRPNGPLNTILESIGLDFLAVGWLGHPTLALYAVLVAGIWGGVGFLFVILSAALRNVDQTLVDAAHVDGANTWQRFRNVTLPQIRRVLTMVIVLSLIGGFAAFDTVYVMTGGGPAGSTELIATYSYRQAFLASRVGYGTALSLVITALSLVGSLIYLRVRDRED